MFFWAALSSTKKSKTGLETFLTVTRVILQHTQKKNYDPHHLEVHLGI